MKKNLFSKLSILLLLAGGLSISSCLKDSRYVDFSKVGTLIELPLAAANGLGNLTPEALPILTTSQTIPVVVNVASPKPLNSALTVTLAVDQAALAAYNAKIEAQYKIDSTAAVAAGNDPGTPTFYSLPPTGSYSISSLKVTVPANQRMATLNISVITSMLDPSAFYIIPISIVDASGQKISNYKTLLLNVQAKNKYDGVYDLTGYVHRDLDMSLGGPMKSGLTAPLATTGANSVSFNQTWADGSIAGGINPLTLTVNAATNVVTVTSNINATMTTQTGYNSRYDPSTKTFYIAVIWNGSDPAHRSAIDTLTYKSIRP